MLSKQPIKPVNKQKPTLASTNQIQPISELYLRQFFANYHLKVDQKQTKNMFNSSIEVLDCLVEEYEQKFGVPKNVIPQETNGDQSGELLFEGFYNRLKMLLEQIYQRHCNQSQQQGQFNAMKQNNERSKQYDDFLFPQSSRSPHSQKGTKAINAQTDQQLYQLVVELNKKSQEERQQIVLLQREMSQVKKSLKQCKEKLTKEEENSNQKEQRIKQLVDQLANNNKEKELMQMKINKLQKDLSQLASTNEKNETLMLLKNQQLKRLKPIESSYQNLLKENSKLNQQVTQLSQKLQQLSNQKDSALQNKYQLQETKTKLENENIKLKTIIKKKLSLITTTQTDNVQNNKISQQTHQYIKSIIQPLLKNQKLLSSSLERELSIFIDNINKQQLYLQGHLNPLAINNAVKLQQNR